MNNEIYINAIKQISVQQPLSDEWFDVPAAYSESYVRAIDPDFKQYFAPNVARRLGKILKRALLVSQKVMEESGVQNPDAIITGTGLGCIENTEIFLDKLVREGEELLNPTYFMQSTHNTISSLIAIDAKCHGYNSTYAHKGISFECALQDAFLQMKGAKIKTALVGAHDEMTPAYFQMLKKSGYFNFRQIDDRLLDIRHIDENEENLESNSLISNSLISNNLISTFAGETAVAMMLSTEKTEKSLCKIENVEKFYGNQLDTKYSILDTKPDFIMVGTNGVAENDNDYFENCARLFPNIPLLQYKNIFGESYTAPAFGVYAAALCLQRSEIPEFLFIDKNLKSTIVNCKSKIVNILVYNQFEGKNHSFIHLSVC